MQNTTSIQAVPQTLISNFFVAGIHSETLVSCLKIGKAVNIPPEVLFHTYGTLDRVRNYLPLVFPQSVSVDFKPSEPRFHSLMTTDAGGYNSFMHVLTFHEEVNEAEIQGEDFDIINKIWAKQQEKECQKRKKKKPVSTAEEEKSQAQPNLGTTQEVTHVSMFQSHEEFLRRRTKRFERPQITVEDINNLNTSNMEEDRIQIVQEEIKLVDTQTAIGERDPQQSETYLSLIGKKARVEDEDRQKIKERIVAQKNKDKMKKQYMQEVQDQFQKKFRSNLTITPNYFNAFQRKQSSGASFLASDMILESNGNVGNQSVLVRYGATTAQMAPPSPPTLQKAQSLHKQRPSPSKFQGGRMLHSVINPSQTAQRLNTVAQNIQQNNLPEVEISYADDNEEDDPKKLMEQHQKDYDNFFQETEAYGVTTDKSQAAAAVLEDAASESNYNLDDELYKKKKYIPVALVMLTATEYHDFFRQVMLAIFDMIRVPPEMHSLPQQLKPCGAIQHKQRIIESRQVAFGDLIAHIAFLKTIPALPFNSVYNIQMLPIVSQHVPQVSQQAIQAGMYPLHTFQLREYRFNQLPRRSLLPIKILFDVLDVRSIIYCWKALLLDKSLAIVSSQYSLQFYVAEALKQLLFPLTWSQAQVIPGNRHTIGYCDGTIKIIYGSHSAFYGFDYFDGLPDQAVVDIDGCFTNELPMPKLPNEQEQIRILNIFKNSKINYYDRAYQNPLNLQDNLSSGGTALANSGLYSSGNQDPQQLQALEDFVMKVQEFFLQQLLPFIQPVEDFIDKQGANNANGQPSTFDQYFQKQDYVEMYKTKDEMFEDKNPQWGPFAEALVQSSQFVHFCDDYFVEEEKGEVKNFQMFKAIMKQRAGIGEDGADIVEGPASSDDRFRTFQNIDGVGCNPMTRLEKWPETQPVVFNFRMPNELQKAMLFERLHYANDLVLGKKEAEASQRVTNVEIMENKEDLRYAEIITDIRRAYFQGLSKCKNAANTSINVSQLQVGGKYSPANETSQKAADVPKLFQKNTIKLTFGQAESVFLLQGIKVEDLDEQATQIGSKQETTPNTATFEGHSPNDDDDFDEVIRHGTQTDQLQSHALPPQAQGMVDPEQSALTARQAEAKQLPLAGNLLAPPASTQAAASMDQSQILLQTSQYLGLDSSGAKPGFDFRYIYDEEYRRVRMCTKRISRLMYGKEGLVTFMHHLLALLDEETRGDTLNYYTAMRDQLGAKDGSLESAEKDVWEKRVKSGRHDRNPIPEASNEDEEEKKSMDFSYSNNNDKSGGPKGKEGNFMLKSNHSLSQGGIKVSGMNVSMTSYSRLFKSDRDWVSINDWSSTQETLACCKLRRTQQYVTFKTKLIEAFECLEDAHSLIWVELFRYYRGDMNLFPVKKYVDIWENLTVSQQDEWFAHHGQAQRTPQIELILKLYAKTRNNNQNDLFGTSVWGKSSMISSDGHSHGSLSSRGTSKNDEKLFQGASIKKTWADKKREAKLAREKEQQRLLAAQQYQESIISKPQLNTANPMPNPQRPKDNPFANPIKGKISSQLKKEKESKSDKKGGFWRIFGLNKQHTSSSSCERGASTQSNDKIEEQKIVVVHHVSTNNLAKTMKESKTTLVVQDQKSPLPRSISAHIDYDMSNSHQRGNHNQVESKQLGDDDIKLTAANIIADHILFKILGIMARHFPSLDTRQFRFKESSLATIQEEFAGFGKYFDMLRPRIVLNATDAEIQLCGGSRDEAINRLKMCFFLNIYNFLVLYNLTILLVSNPEAVENMTNYNMWQSFLSSGCWIHLNGNYRINAYTIFHSILRGKLTPPSQLTHFLLETGLPCCPSFQDHSKYQFHHDSDKQSSMLNESLRDLVVDRPNPLIAFGAFFPLKGMPKLKPYNVKDIHDQLKKIACSYLSSRVKVIDDYHLVVMPKFIKWYRFDFLIQQPHRQGGAGETSDTALSLIRALHKLIHTNGRSKTRPSPYSNFLSKHGSSSEDDDSIQIVFSRLNWQLKLDDIYDILWPAGSPTGFNSGNPSQK